MNDTDDKIGHYCRILTREEVEKLQNDNQTVSEFRQEKLEKEAGRNWDKFYNRHSVNFFKDRHWTKEEFQEICPDIKWQVFDDIYPPKSFSFKKSILSLR